MARGVMTGSTVFPSLRYREAEAAVEWLCRVLGFRRHAVHQTPGRIHAELVHGTAGMLMVATASEKGDVARYSAWPAETGGRETVGLSVVAEDCRAVYERAVAAGAEIVQEYQAPGYGGEAFACRDPEGHIWWVGSYNPWAGQSEGGAGAPEPAEGTA